MMPHVSSVAPGGRRNASCENGMRTSAVHPLSLTFAAASHTAFHDESYVVSFDQVPKLLPYFDGALNEQCFQYKECAKLTPFVKAGKPVFGVEYKLDPTAFCPKANAMNFDFLKKRLKLDAWRVACQGA